MNAGVSICLLGYDFCEVICKGCRVLLPEFVLQGSNQVVHVQEPKFWRDDPSLWDPSVLIYNLPVEGESELV